MSPSSSTRGRRPLLASTLLPLLLSAAAPACTPDRDTSPASDAERLAILGLLDQVDTMRALVSAPDRSGDLLLSSVRTGPALALLAPGVTAPEQQPEHDDADLARSASDLSACTAATASAATFTGCEVGGHLVDGVVSYQNRRVDAELFDVFVYNEGSEGAVAIDGTLTRGANSLRGAIAIDASWATASGEALFDARAEFDDVVLDGSGCPVGGTLTVAGSLAAGTTGPTSVSRSFAFGPDCGDVVVLR